LYYRYENVILKPTLYNKYLNLNEFKILPLGHICHVYHVLSSHMWLVAAMIESTGSLSITRASSVSPTAESKVYSCILYILHFIQNIYSLKILCERLCLYIGIHQERNADPNPGLAELG
jgi:hypothetical protein